MKQKALENLKAAQTLIDTKSYNSSIHCSYYAVLQYMKYMLAQTDNNSLSYRQQESSTSNGKDSHEFLIIEIKNRIDSISKARNFCEGIRFLKRNRREADYDQRLFSEMESLECVDDARGLISKLKTYFGNI
jgi:uncharacterized protein (UPF0332 family)